MRCVCVCSSAQRSGSQSAPRSERIHTAHEHGTFSVYVINSHTSARGFVMLARVWCTLSGRAARRWVSASRTRTSLDACQKQCVNARKRASTSARVCEGAHARCAIAVRMVYIFNWFACRARVRTYTSALRTVCMQMCELCAGALLCRRCRRGGGDGDGGARRARALCCDGSFKRTPALLPEE